jgi:hypothetical protein
MIRTLAVVAIVASLASSSAGGEQPAAPPDTVFVNGAVVTMAKEGDSAQAVAVRGGQIVAVGSTPEIRSLAGPATTIVDLAGKTLLPGFYAAHDHFPGSGRVELYQVDLNSPPIGSMRSVDDIVAALRERATRTAPGQWIVGRGYDDTLIAQQRHPTRHDLDRASSDHPIWIVHTSGHLGVANTRALALAGINKDTPQPAGGAIRKDAAGEPTGVIEERTSLVCRSSSAWRPCGWQTISTCPKGSRRRSSPVAARPSCRIFWKRTPAIGCTCGHWPCCRAARPGPLLSKRSLAAARCPNSFASAA